MNSVAISLSADKINGCLSESLFVKFFFEV